MNVFLRKSSHTSVNSVTGESVCSDDGFRFNCAFICWKGKIACKKNGFMATTLPMAKGIFIHGTLVHLHKVLWVDRLALYFQKYFPNHKILI